MKQIRIFLLATACCIILGCTGACTVEEAEDPARGSDLFAAEVRIIAGDHEGGGTLVRAGETYIVSAAHLIAYYDDKSEVRTASGTALSCTPLWIDPDTDIAILSCSGAESEGPLEYSGMLETSAVRKACPLAVLCLQASGEGTCSGFITGTDVTFSGQDAGTVYMELLIDAEEGMSGSGIYDDAGRYAGMLCGRLEGAGSSGSRSIAAGIGAEQIMNAIDALPGH